MNNLQSHGHHRIGANSIEHDSLTDVHGPRSRDPRTSLGRTNPQWLEDLRCLDAGTRETAVADLRRYLWSGLGKAFATESSVHEPDLDDFTHDAIIRILGALDSFRGDSRFTTWAMSIAMRVAYTALRRRRYAHVSLDDINHEADAIGWEPSSSSADAARRVERDEMVAALRAAIFERLTERQRTVILSELQGVASDRVADLLGTNRNAIYKVYHDARKKLRAALNDSGFRTDDVRDLWEDS